MFTIQHIKNLATLEVIFQFIGIDSTVMWVYSTWINEWLRTSG